MKRQLVSREDNPINRWSLANDFDRLFEGFLRPVNWVEEADSFDITPAMDVKESEDAFLVNAELPGINKDDINITLENGVLTITAETRSDEEQKQGERIIRKERRYGKYVRSLRLGTQIDESKVKANYKDGVLQLTLAKAEEVKPKKISVDIA
jgi:HSP20 family protein